ncbi:MAG: hypothetical protein M3458_05345 [Acidobacteriota bacterium]|nr:hypothetical protein [Acidobacteriota bacterium]
MPITTAQKTGQITRTRQGIAELTRVINDLKGIDTRFLGLDFNNAILQTDFVGDNQGILKAELVAGVIAMRAVIAAWDANRTALLTVGD